MKEFTRQRLEKASEAAEAARFAKTGKLDSKYHRWLIQAFEARQTATYGADLEDEASPESVRSRIEQAEELIEAVREYLAEER